MGTCFINGYGNHQPSQLLFQPRANPPPLVPFVSSIPCVPLGRWEVFPFGESAGWLGQHHFRKILEESDDSRELFGFEINMFLFGPKPFSKVFLPQMLPGIYWNGPALLLQGRTWRPRQLLGWTLTGAALAVSDLIATIPGSFQHQLTKSHRCMVTVSLTCRPVYDGSSWGGHDA